MLVAGVDGCRGGWVVVRASANGAALRLIDATVLASFRDVIALTIACAAVAVDIPIGLPEDGPRAADIETRRRLGPRRSSVWPAPVRCTLEALNDYATACDRSQAACGKRIARQLFNILPKIHEADDALTPADQARVFECHPELSFAMLNGGVAMSTAKKRPGGRNERVSLLSTVLPGVEALLPPPGAAWDDLHDACVLAWTASRAARGIEGRLPIEPQHDARGLRMEIVY